MPAGSFFRGVAINAAKCRRIRLEALQSRFKESSRAAIRATLHVVICSGNLNETLKKLLDVGLRNQPDRFPRLVRLPEASRIEMIEAFAEVMLEIGLRHKLPSCRVAGLPGEETREPGNLETSNLNLRPGHLSSTDRTSTR